jgi:hypothetical protein
MERVLTDGRGVIPAECVAYVAQYGAEAKYCPIPCLVCGRRLPLTGKFHRHRGDPDGAWPSRNPRFTYCSDACRYEARRRRRPETIAEARINRCAYLPCREPLPGVNHLKRYCKPAHRQADYRLRRRVAQIREIFARYPNWR